MNKHSLLLLFYICIFLLGSFHPLFSTKEDKIALTYSGLRNWAESNSPVYGLIQKQTMLSSAEARLDMALQPTNPQFSYSREYVKHGSLSESEQLFTLSKTFELPWLYAKRRQSFKSKELALKSNREFQVRQFMAGIKSGYAELSLMTDQLRLLGQVSHYLKKMVSTAENRRENGFLTGYEVKMMDIALMNLEGKILTLTRQRQLLENNWKLDMGLEPEAQLHLTDRLTYKSLKTINFDIQRILEQMPGFIQRRHEARMLSLQLNIEKQSIIPAVTLFGGYKKVNPHLKGYAAGLSFDLPILNRNRQVIKKKQLDLEIHGNQFALFKKEIRLRLQEKVKALNQYSTFLAPMSSGFSSLQNQLEPVASAYGEGLLSTNDFVNILQTYINAVEQYHSHLLAYFKTIHHLETATGTCLYRL